jgi:putative transposase
MLIAGLASEFPVQQLCAVLGVTRSSYYAWKTCKTYVLSQHKEAIAKRVKKVFEAHKERYGARRIEADLKADNMPVGRYQIRQRMQEMGLKAIQPKSYVPRTTQTNRV